MCPYTCMHRPRHPHGRRGRTALAARAGRAIGRTAAGRHARAAQPPAGAAGDAARLPRAGAACMSIACALPCALPRALPCAHGTVIRTACARHVRPRIPCVLQYVVATRLATRRVAGGVPAHRGCTSLRWGASHFHREHAAGLLPLPATRHATRCGGRPAARCPAAVRARLWADRRHGEWRPPLQHTHRGYTAHTRLAGSGATVDLA